jgi:hypothetical protein
MISMKIAKDLDRNMLEQKLINKNNVQQVGIELKWLNVT